MLNEAAKLICVSEAQHERKLGRFLHCKKTVMQYPSSSAFHGIAIQKRRESRLYVGLWRMQGSREWPREGRGDESWSERTGRLLPSRSRISRIP